jgi:hypothetical protein
MKRLSHSLFFAIAGILLLIAVAVASVTAGYLLAPQPAIHQTLPSGTNTIQFSCTIPVEVRIAPQFQTIRAVNSVPEGYRATATSGSQAITFTPYRGFVARPYLTCILPPGQNFDVVITDDHQRGWPAIVSVVDIWPLTEQEELIVWALVALLLLSSAVMMGIGIRKRKACANNNFRFASRFAPKQKVSVLQ